MEKAQREILQKLIQKHQGKVATLDLHKLCFDKQLAFINDPSQFAMAVTSRRAGKTTACAWDLLSVANGIPKSICLYVTLARTNAKRIIWPMLLEFNRDYKLGGTPNESDLSLKFPNGSIIYVSGAATAGEIDRFLGLALQVVYIDESQSFPSYLEQLINRVLVPACFDKKGKIRLIGTPGPVPVGYYYEAYSSSMWSHHHWTLFDNPWIYKKRGESPEKILEQEMARRGVTENDPTIQREMFGKFVVDSKRLVIDYDPTRNHFDSIPHKTLHHIIGIDVGFQDADAICVLAYSPDGPTTYLVDEAINSKQGLTELVIQIEILRKKYNAHKLVIDEGGLGLKLAEEMRRRYAIPVYGADKKRKFETIEFLNDALRTQKFMAGKFSRFANDAHLMEWDIDKSKPDRKVVSDRFHSDIIDAVLYAFKESPAYAYQKPVTKPKYQTIEWFKDEVDKMEQATIDRLIKENGPTEGMEWL